MWLLLMIQALLGRALGSPVPPPASQSASARPPGFAPVLYPRLLTVVSYSQESGWQGIPGIAPLFDVLACVEGDSLGASHWHHTGSCDEKQPRRHHNLQLGTGIWSWHPACPHPHGAK